jgi:hypothetical protein
LKVTAEIRIEKEFTNKPKEKIDPEEWSLQEQNNEKELSKERIDREE